jgi:hypothetical protein
MLTTTWRRRLDTLRTGARRTGLAVGVGSCSIVAATTLWGWLFDAPADVAIPARSAVNRALLAGSFAQDCVVKLLTATQTQQHTLDDCWAPADHVRLPTTPAVVVESPGIAAVTLQDDRGDAQQWSVVIVVSQRPYASATPLTTCYRLAVLYSRFGLRAPLRPAQVNCPGPGADIALHYPVTVAPYTTLADTVTGFLTAYLTGAGGLERYATSMSGLLPLTGYRSAALTKLVAEHAISDHDTPAEGTTVHAIATADLTSTQFTPMLLDFPMTLAVTGGRWMVAALDLAPQLAPGAELTPVVPGPNPR